ncbi:hypothetical protein MOX02_24140 [Methylobacterium oxalidis]|uniref:Uncharacterized protein n=1 Tax=Methylobacterium oxalidis TaxID=944322 RepID=A0A512J344_9HYPH|nr:hypothetical protein MOX02_24140 [Methylobacterium oxalidis]GLS62748.1 hypothetical protein GCM10007888_11290 [Methylobacterium oxalidis]
MANLIKFPGRPHRTASVYKLHRFAPDGNLQATVLVPACNETEAKRLAGELTQGLRAELWSSGRLLEDFAAPDHPVAASIRLVGDPAISPERDP